MPNVMTKSHKKQAPKHTAAEVIETAANLRAKKPTGVPQSMKDALANIKKRVQA